MSTWLALKHHLTVAAKLLVLARLRGIVRAGWIAVVLEIVFLAMLAAADIAWGRVDLTISHSVHGPVGWLVSLAFLVHAGSLGALSVHLRGAPSAAVGVAALGMVLVFGFPTGSGWIQTIHVLGASLAFGGIAVAAALLTNLRKLGIIVVLGTFVMAMSLFLGGFPYFERLQVLLNGAWILAAAWPRFSTPARSPAS